MPRHKVPPCPYLPCFNSTCSFCFINSGLRSDIRHEPPPVTGFKGGSARSWRECPASSYSAVSSAKNERASLSYSSLNTRWRFPYHTQCWNTRPSRTVGSLIEIAFADETAAASKTHSLCLAFRPVIRAQTQDELYWPECTAIASQCRILYLWAAPHIAVGDLDGWYGSE